jgi:hypothetical protein
VSRHSKEGDVRRTFFGILLVSAAAGLGAAALGAAAPGNSKTRDGSHTITLCAALDDERALNGKTVTVRATYRYAYEAQELYCLNCATLGRTWIEWRDDDATRQSLARLPAGSGTANVVVSGRFVSEGHYGRTGAYRFQLEDATPLTVALVEPSGATPDRLPPRDRARVCQE